MKSLSFLSFFLSSTIYAIALFIAFNTLKDEFYWIFSSIYIFLIYLSQFLLCFNSLSYGYLSYYLSEKENSSRLSSFIMLILFFSAILPLFISFYCYVIFLFFKKLTFFILFFSF